MKRNTWECRTCKKYRNNGFVLKLHIIYQVVNLLDMKYMKYKEFY